MKWPHFVSPYVRIDCPDGPRFILRKPEKAFRTITPDWSTRIRAVVRTLKLAEVNFDVETAKRFSSVAETLGRNYAELQMHYQNAYLHFVASPCSKDASEALGKANKEIRRLEFRLREIEIKTEKNLVLIKPKKHRKTRNGGTEFAFQMDIVPMIIGDLEESIAQFSL